MEVKEDWEEEEEDIEKQKKGYREGGGHRG